MLTEFFNLVAGFTLFLFTIHYIYYIVRALSMSKMQTDEAKYIKKRWKGGSIEPHPTENALVVNYLLEATVFGEPGKPMLEESKKSKKVVRLKTLTPKTDIHTLAKEVIDKCDMIHKSQLSEVEQILFYLQKRKDIGTGSRAMSSRSQSLSRISSSKLFVAAVEEPATIRLIDDYEECLYEDLSERIRGSGLILQLARQPDNLEELEKKESLLSALARVLREDWRQSIDLSTNIIYIFFCFSTYVRFHPVIVQYRIGSLCMEIIDFELKRYDAMKNDLENRKNPDNNRQSARERNKSNDELDTIVNEEKPKEMEPPRRRIPELKQRPKSGNWTSMTSSLLKNHSLNNSFNENLSKSFDGVEIPSLNGSTNSINSPTDPKSDRTISKDELERLTKQLKLFAKKQEQLLRVAFYLLLNIAENVKLEEKMRNKNIIRMLVKSLDRQNVEFLVLVLTFLKKLSIVRVNKDDMSELNIVDRFPRLLQCGQTDVIQVTLNLIFNLSFDGQLRSKMIRVGLLSKLVTFLSDEKHHSTVVRILYHMSMDDKVKSMFTYTECIPLATDMIILNLNPKADIDLVALCINLALNKRNAQLMVENDRLQSLMTRAFKHQDSLLMKMIRNISSHESLWSHFVIYVGDLASVLPECDDEPFTVECLGILGNLSLPELDYSSILQKYNLIAWFRTILVNGRKPDHLVLDGIIFLSTCACDEHCAMLLCKADIILSLVELLKAKQEDDEMVLQIIFVFQQILRCESTRNYMIRDTEAPAYLIDLMQDKNEEIRKVCDYCLDIIATCDTAWATRIKLEKFRNHNSQWLTMVESQSDIDDSQYYDRLAEDDDTDLPQYLTAEYLDQCMMYSGADDSDVRTQSAMSNYSRPISRYSRDIDEIDNLTGSTKSKLSDSTDDGHFQMIAQQQDNRLSKIDPADVITELE